MNSLLENSTRLNEFYSLCRYLALGKGRLNDARGMAVGNGATSVAGIIERALVTPGNLSDPANAGSVAGYAAIAAAFGDSLRFSAFDRMAADTKRAPLRTRTVVTTTGITGSVVGEQQSIPVSRMTLAAGTLEPLRAAGLVAISEPVLRNAGPEGNALFARELRAAVAIATDVQFLAVLTAGISTTTQTGVTAAAIETDLASALAAMNLSAESKLFVLVAGAFAAKLSVLGTTTGGLAFPQVAVGGGSIGALVVVPTDAVSGTNIVVVDATQVVTGSEIVTLDASKEAALQLDSAPDSPPSGTTNMVALWQQGLVGLMAARWFGAARLRGTAVAVIA